MRLRPAVVVFVAAMVGSAAQGWADGPSAETVTFLKSLEGQQKWLRISVVSLKGMFRTSTATSVYANGYVRYENWGCESTTVEDFQADMQRALLSSGASGWRVHVVEKGSPVTIMKTEAKDKRVELELRDQGGSKHKIHYKFEDGRYSYTPETLAPLLALTFAESEEEAQGGLPETVTIKLGMTIDEVLAAKGPAKTRADLGSKTILVYEDLKLVFEDGHLSDVE